MKPNATPVVVLLLASAYALAQNCQTAKFNGQLKGSDAFQQSLGNGLVFRLIPLKDNWGWQIIISPRNSQDDWAYPVNPPLRFGNSQYLGTGYGETVKEQLKHEHEVRFLLTSTDYAQLFELAQDALWPYRAKEPNKATSDYLAALDRVKTGTVKLVALDYDKNGPPEKVNWMSFDAHVITPKGFHGDSGLDWRTIECDSNPSAK